MTAPSQHEVPKVLKAAVIIMGVLLVVGFGALVVTIAVKANKLAARTSDTPPTAGQPVRRPGSMIVPFDTNIDIPDGMEVLGTEVGTDVVLIRVGKGDQQQIIIVDARSGEKRGVITLD